jgi:hypothetical protein
MIDGLACDQVMLSFEKGTSGAQAQKHKYITGNSSHKCTKGKH